MTNVECEIDGSRDAQFVLRAPTSDGPLVRCRNCGLYFISPRENDHTVRDFAVDERAAKYAELEHEVEKMGLAAFRHAHIDEDTSRRHVFMERLNRLLMVKKCGKLLDLGAERGTFLELARAHFDVWGVEADPATSSFARNVNKLNVFTGTLKEARFPDKYFDVVTAFHVLEHVSKTRSELIEIYRVLRPGGLLVLETPNIDTIWFRLLRKHWRQFISDHYFFFDLRTISILLKREGFDVLQVGTAVKPVSVPFALSRLARYWGGFVKIAWMSERIGLGDVVLRINLGDILLAFARRPLTD